MTAWIVAISVISLILTAAVAYTVGWMIGQRDAYRETIESVKSGWPDPNAPWVWPAPHKQPARKP